MEIAEYCKGHEVPHVINNAYGVQASKIMHMVNEAMRVVCLLCWRCLFLSYAARGRLCGANLMRVPAAGTCGVGRGGGVKLGIIVVTNCGVLLFLI